MKMPFTVILEVFLQLVPCNGHHGRMVANHSQYLLASFG